MSTLATALITSLRETGDSLAAMAAADGEFPPASLAALHDLERQPVASAFARAVGQATARLRKEVADPHTVEVLLDMLADPAPTAAQFRRITSEEFLLAGRPNLAPLVDHYRRTLRPAARAQHQELPPWRTLAQALSLLFGRLLPEAIATQPRLLRLLPSPADRVSIDLLRAARPAEQLLDQLVERAPSQAIVASDGAHIAHVQQTIIYGNLYTHPASCVADLTALFVHYRAFVIETFGALDFRGIMQIQSAARISLDQIYIPIFARSRGDTRMTPDGPIGPALVLHDYVREQPFLVVLGDPGSGKSTLVRYLITTLARGDAQERLGLAAAWLPIFFPVAAFADARSRPGSGNLSPLAYLSEYYAGLSQPDYGPLFARALAMGRALLLLDGIDEVREDRPGIVRCLDAFVHEWDAQGNRCIATSRSVGYDDAPLDSRLFVSVVIQPLRNQQINDFIVRWSRAYEALAEPIWSEGGDLYHDLVRDASSAELAIRVEQHVRSLGAAVFVDANVAALGRNPLLLTILALIHNQGARLPDRRVDLYRLCVEALAETWNRARSLSGRSVDLYLGDERLDERFVVNLLGPVALWIHGDQPGGLVDLDDLESHIADTLTQTDGLPRGRARRLAQDFIDLMRRDTGLLQERGYRRFGFLHLTFEEYLAARGLIESVTVDNPDSLFLRYSNSPRWHEVLRLAIAVAPQREAQRLLLLLLTAPTPSAILLAGECLRDIGRNGATQRAWDAVIQALLALIADPAASLEGRIFAGTILGHLGDPRRLDPSIGADSGAHQGVAAYWCRVAPGPFWWGDEGHARRARAGSLRRIDLGRSFAIGRFPITSAEFSDFVAAGGYAERRWWSEAGWLFIDPRIRWTAADLGSPSQPAVGVSWYEASAYCAWLTDAGRQGGWLAADEILRLPTAIEWERAARHTDRRRYPWGDQPPSETSAAFAALGMATPAPVGVFPGGAAACGAQDLSGNIWEWTASLAESFESALPCEDVSPGETPVIKGGAFGSKAEELRCGASSWLHPGQRIAHLGFRVVRTSAK